MVLKWVTSDLALLSDVFQVGHCFTEDVKYAFLCTWGPSFMVVNCSRAVLPLLSHSAVGQPLGGWSYGHGDATGYKAELIEAGMMFSALKGGRPPCV